MENPPPDIPNYISWKTIEQIYTLITRKVIIEKKDIPPAVLDSLYEHLCMATHGFGNIRDGKEAKRLYFGMNFIIAICFPFSFLYTMGCIVLVVVFWDSGEAGA